jgi:hypothetical protein
MYNSGSWSDPPVGKVKRRASNVFCNNSSSFFLGKGVTTVLVAKQCTSVGLYVLN